MSAKIDALKAALTSNSSWTTLVDNTYIPDDLGRKGLDPDNPACDDAWPSGTLTLTAVLTLGASNEANILKSQRQFMQIYFYHDSNPALIRQAQALAKSILDPNGNGTVIAADNQGRMLVRWVNDLKEYNDENLQDAFAGASRYSLLFTR